MYTNPIYISKPVGNNAFSYDQRIALGSTGKLYIPSLIQGVVAELQQSSEICFEEVVENKLVSCTGLKHFLQTTFHEVPVYIVDNHNHALSFRHTQHVNSGTHEPVNLIHIDQHSDIKENEYIFTERDNIETFVNEKTNVGNFITAAINSGIVNEVIQVRSDYALEQLNSSTLPQDNFILDIDIDFRQDKELTGDEISKIRSLIQQATLVTIATSPYFIDQDKAITMIQNILSD